MSAIQRPISESRAFFQQPDYEISTKRDLALPTHLPKPDYVYNTESKVWRVVKDILSVIIFPIAFYHLIQKLSGKLIVPASNPTFYLMEDEGFYNRWRSTALNHCGDWKFKRIAIQVDGFTIDAMLMGKPETLNNKRWVLYSNGNGEFYENKQHDYSFKSILTELEGNALFFNYPGVGCSSGLPSKSAMTKAYQAMLSYLEDQEKGMGAKEIIGLGHSIGGGVQGEALKTHKLKKNIKYVFVKDRTFSDIYSVIHPKKYGNILGFLVKFFGWNMSSVESSRKLKAPEIIVQSADVEYEDISKCPEKIYDDGAIPVEASLAKNLLEDPRCPKENKYFLGIPEDHNTGIRDTEFLTRKIIEMLG